MGAARASTAGHLPPAFSDLSETQTAYTTGHVTSGFLLLTASLGTSPLPFSSLLFTSFTHHQTPFTHPVGVVFHSMFNTAAASLSTGWPRGQCKACQPPPFFSKTKCIGHTRLFLKLET
jgi:hypothetical protein